MKHRKFSDIPALDEAYQRGYYDGRVDTQDEMYDPPKFTLMENMSLDTLNMPLSTFKRTAFGLQLAGLESMYQMFLDSVRDNNFRNNKHGWFNDLLINFFDIKPEKLLVAEDEYVWMQRFCRELATALTRARVIANVKVKVIDLLSGHDKALYMQAKTYVEENPLIEEV